ncbi:unnamed protein product, partial [marine sediment metagenome]
MKKIEKSLKRALISIISLIALMSMSIALNAEVLAGECSQNNLLLAKTENQIRYDGIYQADAGKGKWYYLRFYPKGKVLRVRCGTSIPPTKIVHLFLRKKYSRLMATSKPVVIGWYKVNGSDIEFRLDRGKGLYMGKFNDYGDSLTLSWFDSN